MKLRLIESLKAMFTRPRVGGVVLLWIVPTFSACIFHGFSTLSLIFSVSLFLFCFCLVRGTLD